MRCRRNNNGFTLIEVLVALVVLGVALAALVKTGSEHARNTGYLRERTLAHWVGQNLLAEYEAGMRAVADGDHSGEVIMGPYRYGYQTSVTDFTANAPFPLPPVKRVDVRVWTAEGGEEQQRANVSGFVLP